MISILYYNRDDKTGNWKAVDEGWHESMEHDDDSVTTQGDWIAETFNGQLRPWHSDMNIYIEFEKHEDATLFILKFGL
jgi:hypothetical protein